MKEDEEDRGSRARSRTNLQKIAAEAESEEENWAASHRLSLGTAGAEEEEGL